MIGSTLAHYRITAKLGEGGMGEVYLAEDTKLRREVALKVLPEEMAADSERLERFEQEARSIAALNHPNIVTIHSVEQAGPTHLLTMELVNGESLDQVLPPTGFDLDRFFSIATQIADGLGAAHDKGITHRDLKPANVMVTKEGRVKVLDFGLAKLATSEAPADEATQLLTKDGMILGTVPYMSPEQAQSKPVDPRSDVFSLGILLYEMATGQRPFQGSDPASVMAAVLRDQPIAVTELRGELPNHLGRIVQRCLEKDRERRYQSARDVRHELEGLRDEVRLGTATTSRASSSAASTAPPTPKRSAAGRWLWPLIGAVLITLLAVVLFPWLSNHSEPASGMGEIADGLPKIRSLAVLPFTDLSADASKAYLSAGMTDVLTTELAQLKDLTVVARSAAHRFSGSSLPPAEIARELAVEALVSGSVLRHEDRVRISAELANAATDRVIWTESYDRPMRDALSLQGEVAQAIAGAIALELSPEEEQRLEAGIAVDPRALEEYLKGRYLWNLRTEEAVRAALAHFRAAVNIAPDFALGHTGVADAYILLGGYDWMEPREALAIALAAVERAQSLDPAAGETHASRGDLLYHLEHDFAGAARELDRALELSPSYATAHYWRAEVAITWGEFEEGRRLAARAVELDALNPFANYLVAFADELAGRTDAAEEGYRAILEFSPGYERPWASLVGLLLDRGRNGEAVAAAQRAVEVNPVPTNLATRAVALALAGDSAEARTALDRLRAMSHERWISPYEVARVEAALGEHGAALRSLEAALEARAFLIPFLKVHVPIEFRDLAGDPVFEDLVARIGANGDSEDHFDEADYPQLHSFAVSYTAAWNSGDPGAVARHYREDGSLAINGGPANVGREALTAVADGFMTAFPDMVLTFDRLTFEDGRIQYHWTFRGTNTGPGGSGHRVDFSGHESWLIADDGLIADSLGTFDTEEYQRQLEFGLAED